MPRPRPPRHFNVAMFCLYCRRGIARGYRLATGELVCRDCWQARQGDGPDGDGEAA